MTFSAWLTRRRSHKNPTIVRLAHLSLHDTTFPRRAQRLSVLVTWAGQTPEDTELRRAVCLAHRHWRRHLARKKAGVR